MIYHIIVGDHAAEPLNELIKDHDAEKLVVLKDILNVGPVQKIPGSSFSAMRTAFWQEALMNEKHNVQVDDMERLLEVSARLYKDENATAWFWMAPLPADVCAYYWVCQYLSKHPGRFNIVNIANLPFLDDVGKIYYPKSISEISAKELLKARKLARPVSATEAETDNEEWERITGENEGIRIHEGGKKIASRNEAYYDGDLLKACTETYQKATKIISLALSKNSIPTGDLFLGWRLKKLAEAGKVQLQGELNKTLRDFDVKLPDDKAEATAGIP